MGPLGCNLCRYGQNLAAMYPSEIYRFSIEPIRYLKLNNDCATVNVSSALFCIIIIIISINIILLGAKSTNCPEFYDKLTVKSFVQSNRCTNR